MILVVVAGCVDESSQRSAVTGDASAPTEGTPVAQEPRAPSQLSAVTGNADTPTEGTPIAQEAFREAARLGKSGKYKEAVQVYSRAIELDPGYRDAYVFRALTYQELGNFAAAIRDLDTVVALDPSATSCRSRADLYARNGYPDKAIIDYDKFLELNPTDAGGHRNRAIAYGEKDDYRRATAGITKAIQLEPDEPRWRFDRGILKAQQGDYDGAMRDAEEALRLAGGVPDLRPGERRVTDELTFNCMRLIADLEKAGAKRAR
ncbi:MAG: tetratricopeptide repeat protein [Acidobacteria bacterium]|nr:tetratricopeptide repeat protein [Acidobacteriota bacterium]